MNKKKGWHDLGSGRYVHIFGGPFGFLFSEVRLAAGRVQFALHESENSLPGNECFQRPTKSPPAALRPHMEAIRRALDSQLKERMAATVQRMELAIMKDDAAGRRAARAVIAAHATLTK